MTDVYNPAPKTTITGIIDEYLVPISPSITPNAFSNMLAFTFGKKGPVGVGVWANGYKGESIYGPEIYDLNNDYTTHQTLFINYANSVNNPLDIIRVVPSDVGPEPAIGLWAEYVHDDVQTYERDPVTNKHKLDNNGQRIPVGTVAGVKVRFFLREIVPGEFGKATSELGSANGTGGQSKVIPLVEFRHSWVGSDGNNVGIRIFPAFANSERLAQVSEEEMKKTGFPFRLQIVRRTTASITGNIVNTAVGNQFVEGSFQPGAIHPLTKANYDLFKLAEREYSDLKDNDAPVYPEIGQYFVYNEHVKELFDALNSYLNEANPYSVNPFTGTDFSGVPYDNYDVLPNVDASFKFATTSTAFLKGGSDGTLSLAEFDLAVRRYLEQVPAWDEHVITNMARHPFKLVVDSGFSLDTKYTMIRFALGIHKACTLLTTPQDAMLPVNDETKDAALIKAITTRIASYPESSVTTATRAMIVGRCGVLSNTTYTGKVPVMFAIFKRIVNMFGSPTGVINVNNVMQVLPNKLINEFISLSYDYQGLKARQRDWDCGAAIIEAYDQRQYQIPAYRSVYSKPVSILSDIGNVIIAVDCIHQLYRTWQDLSGITGLTPEQLIERANTITTNYTKPERYANIVVPVANNYLDAIDMNNKFSWHGNIILQGSVPARNAEISVTSRIRS